MPETTQQKLDRLNKELQESDKKIVEARTAIEVKNKEIEAKTKARDALKSEIANLEKINKEIDQLTNDYTQGYTNIQKGLKEIDDDLKRWRGTAGKVDDKIKSKIEELDAVPNLENQARELEADLDRALTAHDSAKKKRERAQIAYDSLKGGRKTAEGRLKELIDLNQSIEQEQDFTALPKMYLLLEVLLEKAKSHIKTGDDFRRDLAKTWAEVEEAGNKVKEKKGSLEKVKIELAEKQKELDKARGDRIKNMVSSLKTI